MVSIQCNRNVKYQVKLTDVLYTPVKRTHHQLKLKNYIINVENEFQKRKTSSVNAWGLFRINDLHVSTTILQAKRQAS